MIGYFEGADSQVSALFLFYDNPIITARTLYLYSAEMKQTQTRLSR